MPKTTLDEVFQRMKANLKSRQSSTKDGSEETYECNECKDKGIIVYRIHKSTEERMKNEGKRFDLAAHEMVREDDFLAGKVCSPQEAKEWKTTFSRQCPCVAERAAQKIQMQLLSASNISERFKKMTFSSFKTAGKPQVIQEMRECAFEYAKAFQDIKNTDENSIALLGQSGVGKTHLLSAVANGFIETYKIPVLYFPYLEGMTDLRKNFDKLPEKMDLLKNIDVLFIDDLFKSRTNENDELKTWPFLQMQEIINYRYQHQKPIMLSSELTFEDFIQMDEAFGTRLFSMCKNFTVTIEKNIKLNHRLEGAF
ncbi:MULTISPECIES: DnaA ATPase domain-containing protein [Bacillus]|uniref:DnaA ATPase domain-containing protein n=1 Tax=Bacillus TaxID=1386 RepID=UPI002ABDDE16|nr:DnaA/Hda family protein [Bacillus pumilus]